MNRIEGFGLAPTTAAFVASYDQNRGWNQGKWMEPGEQLKIPLQASVLSYGLSVFEGLKAYRTVKDTILLFRVRDHAERFQRSAKAVGLPTFPVEKFVQTCRDTALRNAAHLPPVGKGSLYLRPVLFANEARLGMGLPATARFVLFASPVSEYFQGSEQGVSLLLLDRSRVPAGGIGYAKCSGNYAGTLLTRVQAMHDGYDDVLYCDARNPGTVAELTGANIFARIDETLVVTPPASDQILAGITRDSVIHLMRDQGVNVEERPLTITELTAAQESFCTGTAWGVVGVRELRHGSSSIRFPTMQLSHQLVKKLQAVQTGERADPFDCELIPFE
ncbi:MAG: branched-chain amino acid aminotransferase [bacterium]